MMKDGKTGVVIALLAASGVASAVAAQPATSACPGGPLALTDVQYARLVAGGDLVSHYPSLALDARVEGAVELLCTVTDRGSYADCAVVSETPADYNFGTATKRLVSKVRIEPRSKSGRPTAGCLVPFKVKWRLPR